MMKKVAAVVVTYNRKALLQENIESLLGQTVANELDVLIIDNASMDGTKEAIDRYIVDKKIIYFNTGANLGGAGGFNYGMRKAVEMGYEYVWVMDDDCMPTNNALKNILNVNARLDGEYGFLSSKVLWKDRNICTMNVQRETVFKNVSDFNSDLVEIAMASFVSVFFQSKIIREVGLPIKDFFIWTDDWEFTRRISRKYKSYLVNSSIVIHKSNNNIGANIANDTPDRLGRYKYLYRNDVYLYRREGVKGFLYELTRLIYHIARVVVSGSQDKMARIEVILKATIEGMGFNPEIEFVESRYESLCKNIKRTPPPPRTDVSVEKEKRFNGSLKEAFPCNSTPFFSIIMPVYNAEKYLQKAVDSILSQSFEDFELLLIEDCSQDASSSICEQYAKTDKRVKFLKNDTNSGASASRNKGLEKAKGKYCGFVDADDYIEKDLLEVIYNEIVLNTPDMIKFGVFEEYYDKDCRLKNIKSIQMDDFLISNKQEIYEKTVELEMFPLFGYMCNSFYKREKLLPLRFDVRYKINEDFDYNIRLIKSVESFQGISYCGYHYAKRVNDSMSTRINDNYYPDHMRKIDDFIKLFGGFALMPESVKKKVFWLYTRYVYSTLTRIAEHKERNIKLQKIFESSLYGYFLQVNFANNTLKQRMMIYLLKKKNTTLINAFVYLIGIVKEKFSSVFVVLKR